MHLQVLVFFVQLVEIKLKLNNDKRRITIFFISNQPCSIPSGASVLVNQIFAAKIYQSFLLSAFYAVLFFPISWKIVIKFLVVFFTFFGLEMLRTDQKKIVVQGFANLEKKVGVNPFVTKHLV